MRPSDISNILGRLDADELNDIDRQTREVVRAAEETGLQGEISLKIKIKKNGDNSMLLSTEVKSKVPRKAPGQRVLYFQYDQMDQPTGEISDLPPRQEPLLDKSSNVTSIRHPKN